MWGFDRVHFAVGIAAFLAFDGLLFYVDWRAGLAVLLPSLVVAALAERS